MHSSIDSVRHEFADLDPLAVADPIAEPTLIDRLRASLDAEPLETPRERRDARRKYVRPPARDANRFMHYVGSLLAEGKEDDDTRISLETRLEWANLLNVKPGWAWGALRYYRHRVRPIGPHERAAFEEELAVFRRLRPVRQLIAIAERPHLAGEGEVDEVAEELGAAMPDGLRPLIADVALAVDLSAQLADLRREAVRRLFEIYERLVADAGGVVQTLVVNWHRGHSSVEAIYPPGWEAPNRSNRTTEVH